MKRIKDTRLIRLRECVKRDNIRVETIARKIGVTSRTIYRWIDGITKISPLASAPLDAFLAEIEAEISAERNREISRITGVPTK